MLAKDLPPEDRNRRAACPSPKRRGSGTRALLEGEQGFVRQARHDQRHLREGSPRQRAGALASKTASTRLAPALRARPSGGGGNVQFTKLTNLLMQLQQGVLPPLHSSGTTPPRAAIAAQRRRTAPRRSSRQVRQAHRPRRHAPPPARGRAQGSHLLPVHA